MNPYLVDINAGHEPTVSQRFKHQAYAKVTGLTPLGNSKIYRTYLLIHVDLNTFN